MATYEYQCDRDGVFDVAWPLGMAPESVACTVCGSAARRIFSVPMVKRGSRTAWSTAIERAEKSRYEPDVVTSLPSQGARRRTQVLPLTPTLRGLPRP